MGLFKTLVISAAVYGTYKFLTEQDEFGRTKLEALKDQAPEWLDKVKGIKDDLKEEQAPEGY
ncbi:YtxH domain-containing protein [Pedobacter sp. L105]|uniref:YtxH domain-containing protein n=1 Tax=Pedobacter sp. L105 TaxID=1641871 RepID=UPI00131C32DD|nr:YtxH domain-containing protein [Pedobacter sp. L105]